MLNKNRKNLTTKSGQSLVEAIVAVGIISLVLVGLVSALTFSLSNTQFARNKAEATKYAQEAQEWLRAQRDANSWTSFADAAGDTICESTSYCLNSLTTWPPPTTPCTGPPVAGQFTRTTTLTLQSEDQVNVNVNLSWQQGNRTSQVFLDTSLTNWQPDSAAPEECEIFSGLSASLLADTATFNFSYSGVTTNYIISLSIDPGMVITFTDFGQGPSSPIVVIDPQVVWAEYTCGRTLYWTANNDDFSVTSAVQTAVVSC